MMNSYNRINAHARDARVAFEPEEHIYIVDGDCRCDSVTTVISDYFTKFDADYWARRKATPQCSAEMLKARWKAKAEAAAALGTQMHASIEAHYLGEEPEEKALADGAFRHFLNFTKKYRLTPFRTEWSVFSKRHRIAGTLDFLGHDGGVFEIYDWKRSTKVVDASGRPILANYGKFGNGPLCAVPDTSFHHYALQQSMYRYLLSLNYGIEVSACHLGVFHPDMDDYHVVDVPYLLDEVKAILDTRR